MPLIYAKVLAQSTGEFGALRPAGELDMDALTGQQRRRIGETLAHDVWGTVKEVGEELRGVGKRLGVSEFVVTGDMPDVAGRARSEELLASLRRILVVVETLPMFRLSLSVRPFSRLVFESPGFRGVGG